MRLDQIKSLFSLTVELTCVDDCCPNTDVTAITAITPMLSFGSFVLQGANKLFMVSVDKAYWPEINHVISSGCAYLGKLQKLQTPHSENRYQLQLQVFQHQPCYVDLQIRIAPQFISALSSLEKLKQDFTYTLATSSALNLTSGKDLSLPQLSEKVSNLPAPDATWDTSSVLSSTFNRNAYGKDQSEIKSNHSATGANPLAGWEGGVSYGQSQQQDNNSHDHNAHNTWDFSLGQTWHSPKSFVIPHSMWLLAFTQSKELDQTPFIRLRDDSSNLAYQQKLTRKMREQTTLTHAPFDDYSQWRYTSLHINDPQIPRLQQSLNQGFNQSPALTPASTQPANNETPTPSANTPPSLWDLWQQGAQLWDEHHGNAVNHENYGNDGNYVNDGNSVHAANKIATPNTWSEYAANVAPAGDAWQTDHAWNAENAAPGDNAQNLGDDCGALFGNLSFSSPCLQIPGLNYNFSLGLTANQTTNSHILKYWELPEQCFLVGSDAILTLRRASPDEPASNGGSTDNTVTTNKFAVDLATSDAVTANPDQASPTGTVGNDGLGNANYIGKNVDSAANAAERGRVDTGRSYSTLQVYDVVKVRKLTTAQSYLDQDCLEQPLHLCQGHLEFVQGEKPKNDHQTLTTLTPGQGYLKLWYDYLTLAWEQLINEARKVGVIYLYPLSTHKLKNYQSFSGPLLLGTTYNVPKQLKANDCLRLFTADNIPQFLLNPKIKASELLKQAKVTPDGRLEFSTLNEGLVCKVTHVYRKALAVQPQTLSFTQAQVRTKAQTQAQGKDVDSTSHLASAENAGLNTDSNATIQNGPYVAAVLDITGSLLQLQRSLNAYTHILNQTSAQPQLGAILEGQRAWLTPAIYHHYPALSPRVRNKFANRLNASQQAAIDLAINTPDIALIQGPPGTGKTTVICAIVERLNELISQHQQGGAILISGYQHDAVNNVVSKLAVNDLPTLKFGKAQSATKQDRQPADLEEYRIFDWIEKQSNKLQSHTALKIHVAYEQLQTLKAHYIEHPTIDQAAALIDLLAKLTPVLNFADEAQVNAQAPKTNQTSAQAKPQFMAQPQDPAQEQSPAHVQKLAQTLPLSQLLYQPHAPSSMQPLTPRQARNANLHELQQQYALLKNPLAPEVLQLIYAMRTDEQSYQDDGAANHSALQQALHERLSAAEQALLLATPHTLEDWSNLKALQTKLLHQCKPRNCFSFNSVDYRLLALADQDLKALQKQRKTDKVEQVLFDFNEELAGNAYEVNKALTDYGLAYAATVQQSESRFMRNTKVQQFKRWHQRNKTEHGLQVQILNLPDALAQDSLVLDEALSFDTVIIDEAARCSPLDLLIPLARAKKRIILVGDQNQLPHIVDDKISDILEQAQSKKLESVLSQRTDESAPLNSYSSATSGSGLTSSFTTGSRAGACAGAKSSSRSDSTSTELDIKQLLQQSMFEHLRKVLQCQSDLDQQPRFITLSTQYRMHPKLGEFVSQNFYHGQLQSVLDASHFSHNLPGLTNEFALWCHVPKADQGEGVKNTSRFRIAEARAIAAYLKTWLPELQATKMSVGVITFYQAQVESIKHELLNIGINLEREPLIMINTSDALQGKEFDVVMLSMVRSLDNLKPKPNKFSSSASSDLQNSAQNVPQAHAQAKPQGQAPGIPQATTQDTNLSLAATSNINQSADKGFWGSDANAKHNLAHNIPQAPVSNATAVLSQFKNINQEQIAAARCFGHLISAQRLCVALSRQKRCLMIVGDADLVTQPLGQKYVPALYHFWQLCNSRHCVLPQRPTTANSR